MRILTILGFRRKLTREGKNGSKQEVLGDWKLAQHLGEIHLDHARVNFVPCFHLSIMSTKLLEATDG